MTFFSASHWSVHFLETLLEPPNAPSPANKAKANSVQTFFKVTYKIGRDYRVPPFDFFDFFSALCDIFLKNFFFENFKFFSKKMFCAFWALDIAPTLDVLVLFNRCFMLDVVILGIFIDSEIKVHLFSFVIMRCNKKSLLYCGLRHFVN